MTSRGRPASRQALARSDGLTILELLIALTLLAVVVGGLYRFVATGSQSARLTNNFLQIQAPDRGARRRGRRTPTPAGRCPRGRRSPSPTSSCKRTEATAWPWSISTTAATRWALRPPQPGGLPG